MKRVNLIPSDFNRENVVKRKNIRRFATTCVWLIMFYIAWQATAIFRYQFRIARQKKEVKLAQQRLDDAQAQKEIFEIQLNEIHQMKKEVEKNVYSLKKSKQKSIYWSKVLLTLEELYPENIVLSALSLSIDEILIEGVSLEETRVSDLMDSIETSPYFHHTGFNFIKKGEEDDLEYINFEISSMIVKNKLIKNP